MKIVYVTASLPYGTTEVFAIPEVRELVRRGHEVQLVPILRHTLTPHSDAEPFLPFTRFEPLTSGPVLRAAAPEFARSPLSATTALSRTLRGQSRLMTKKNLGSFPKALWLAQLARHWGADHIHAYWASVAATTAMIAAEVSAIPWSFTAHRWDIAAPNAFRAKLESARFTRFISQDGLELARPVAGPQLDEKATVIRMGVPLTQQQVTRTEPPTGVALRLICTATLIPRKGQRFLLEAVSALKAQGVSVQVFLAGEGPTREALAAQAEALGITDQVVFMGNVDHGELLAGYAEGRYDAFILPSLHEGISVALIEAMSYGLPAIATDVGGTRELLTEGVGQLISPKDVGSIIDAITRLVRNEPAQLEQGRRGRARVMAEYDIQGVVDALEARFRSSPTKRKKETVSL